MSQLKIRHKEIVAKLDYLITSLTLPEKDRTSPMVLGKALFDLGWDEKTDGFWVLELGKNVEYFSPAFRNSLGYSGEHDFPSVPASWQKIINKEDLETAQEAFDLHLEDTNNPYYLWVRYTHKKGHEILLICAGTIVNPHDENKIMIGTHEIHM